MGRLAPWDGVASIFGNEIGRAGADHRLGRRCRLWRAGDADTLDKEGALETFLSA
jgi:hypothetical protein